MIRDVQKQKKRNKNDLDVAVLVLNLSERDRPALRRPEPVRRERVDRRAHEPLHARLMMMMVVMMIMMMTTMTMTMVVVVVVVMTMVMTMCGVRSAFVVSAPLLLSKSGADTTDGDDDDGDDDDDDDDDKPLHDARLPRGSMGVAEHRSLSLSLSPEGGRGVDGTAIDGSSPPAVDESR